MNRSDLLDVLRATGCAREAGGFVFLCDPRWNEQEKAQVRALEASASCLDPNAGWICIPTGGTSGVLRFARHDERTLGAAVAGFVQHFRLSRTNAVDVLPPFHVSGLMARARCAVTGGTHVAWDWKRLEAGQRPDLPRGTGDWVLSLVPTQLQRLLASVEATRWLQQFCIVFLGGAPAWSALTDDAAAKRIRVSLSYGLTETAAMVAAQRPEEFAAGERNCGSPLPHAHLALTSAGTIRITGESVFCGYYPHFSDARSVETADLGRIDAHGRLHVLGRSDAVIISGGEKVNPLEVEAVLRATGAFDDLAVIGLADPEWGEVVVACYGAPPAAAALELARRCAAEKLSGFKRPKHYVRIAEWPGNAQGKLNREKLKQLAAAALAGNGGA